MSLLEEIVMARLAELRAHRLRLIRARVEARR